MTAAGRLRSSFSKFHPSFGKSSSNKSRLRRPMPLFSGLSVCFAISGSRASSNFGGFIEPNLHAKVHHSGCKGIRASTFSRRRDEIMRNSPTLQTSTIVAMRAGFALLSLSLAFSTAPLNAQRPAGPELRGVPASVTSPRPDGTLRGIPGSVTDPRAAFGFRGSVSFGHGRPIEPLHHRRPAPVVVVPYYAYPYAYDYSAYEEPQPAVETVQPQVIVIKDETAHSDDSSRYGEHSFEEREPAHDEAVQPKP